MKRASTSDKYGYDDDRKVKSAQRYELKEKKRREYVTKYIADEYDEYSFDIKRALKGKHRKQG